MDKMTTKEYLSQILRPRDKVIVCAEPDRSGQTLTTIRELGAEPVETGTDRRWQSLVRLVLLNRVTVAVGHWRWILGLTKLAKATTAPLRIRNVVLTGEVCPDWALAAICSGLDARVCDCTDGEAVQEQDAFTQELERSLLPWASILDYRAEKMDMGLSLEVVVFPGKQLPKLPSGARVIIRPWEPGVDAPFQSPL